MYIINLCKQILHDMWARKVRSMLALFGIIWGTISVILLLALGTGFHDASLRSVMKVADGTFFVILNKTSKSHDGFPKGQPINVKSSVIMNLPKNVPGITMVTPMLSTSANVSFKKNMTKTTIYGASTHLSKLVKLDLIKNSRFINRIDIKNKNRVAILGYKIKNRLFGNKPALGKTFTIKNVEFRVIGILEKPSLHHRDSHNNDTIIPYATYISLFGDVNSYFFVALPNPHANPSTVQESLREYLANHYHFDKKDKTALRIFDTTKIFQFFKWFFFGIQLFLGFCGALTLAVGSLGVANIMFLIVSERTREIGLRMAIGAKDWQILLQIMLEAVIIIGLGGLIGFLVSLLTIKILAIITLPSWLGTPQMSMISVFVTIGILSLLGIFSGLFPARRAARMDPVEAIGMK